MILQGKRILVTGVATRHSIAFAIAEAAQAAGAEIVLTSFGRLRSMTERAAKRLPRPVEILELDVTKPSDFEQLGARFTSGKPLHGVVHSIAFAGPEAVSGNFLSTPPESALGAIEISALSLGSLAGALREPLASSGSGSIVALDFDAAVAWPGYDWMGVAKATLESIARYLARDLGPEGTRVNLVAAGPLRTPAASAFEGFSALAEMWGMQAPLGWDDEDRLSVAHAACFLLSDWARGVTGEILHVDGGYHAMGTWLRAPDHLTRAEPATPVATATASETGA